MAKPIARAAGRRGPIKRDTIPLDCAQNRMARHIQISDFRHSASQTRVNALKAPIQAICCGQQTASAVPFPENRILANWSHRGIDRGPEATPPLHPLPLLHPIEEGMRMLDRLTCAMNAAFDGVRVSYGGGRDPVPL